MAPYVVVYYQMFDDYTIGYNNSLIKILVLKLNVRTQIAKIDSKQTHNRKSTEMQTNLIPKLKNTKQQYHQLQMTKMENKTQINSTDFVGLHLSACTETTSKISYPLPLTRWHKSWCVLRTTHSRLFPTIVHNNKIDEKIDFQIFRNVIDLFKNPLKNR